MINHAKIFFLPNLLLSPEWRKRSPAGRLWWGVAAVVVKIKGLRLALAPPPGSLFDITPALADRFPYLYDVPFTALQRLVNIVIFFSSLVGLSTGIKWL